MVLLTLFGLAVCSGAVCLGLLLRARHQLKAKSDTLAALQEQLEHQKTEELYRRISTERADTGLVILKLDATVVWTNKGYLKMMDLPAETVIGHSPLHYAFAPENRPSEEEIANFRYDPDDYDSETRVLRENTRGNGDTIWVQITTSFHDPYGENPLAIVVVHDVTEDIAREAKLRATSEELAFIAAHDPLTGAANRSQLTQFLDAELTKTREGDKKVGVLHIDLDKFKHINDSYGHSAGDVVLKAVTDRINAQIRDGDMIARVGGDEFVVVCPGMKTLHELQAIGYELSQVVSQPIPWSNTNLPCQISIGAALSNEEEDDLDALLARSDFALYEVKRTGRGRVATYNHALHLRYTQESQRELDLLETIQNKALDFHMQPIIMSKTGAITGFETLVRWRAPDDQLIAPDEFLPLAQGLGLMADVDFMAMNAALDFQQRLKSMGYKDLQVGFNTSPEVLSHPDFLASLLSGLDFRGLLPSDIVLEVLETVVFETHGGDTPFVQRVTELHEAGFSMLLDDFGKGHAGLAHLSQLAISGVKIDRSITERAMKDATTELVLRTLVDLCHNLNLRIVTEGVETTEQALLLTLMGSTKLQGYFIARPMPQEAALEWLAQYDASAIAPWDSPRYLQAN